MRGEGDEDLREGGVEREEADEADVVRGREGGVGVDGVGSARGREGGAAGTGHGGGGVVMVCGRVRTMDGRGGLGLRRWRLGCSRRPCQGGGA